MILRVLFTRMIVAVDCLILNKRKVGGIAAQPDSCNWWKREGENLKSSSGIHGFLYLVADLDKSGQKFCLVHPSGQNFEILGQALAPSGQI